MKTSFLLCITYLVSAAWAGGYAGALERVWLWYAYQIEGYNTETQQVLGFKCVGPATKKNKFPSAFNKDTGKCEGTWLDCGTARNKDSKKRCNFTQLMFFLGGVPESNVALTADGDPNSRTPAIRDTAAKMWDFFVNKQKAKNGVPDYGPENFLKITNGEFNHFIRTVSIVVSRTGTLHRAANQDLFNGFNDATNQIKQARLGSNGAALIKKADTDIKGKLGLSEIPTISVLSDDTPPRAATDSNGNPILEYKTIDWVKLRTSVSSSVSAADAERTIGDFYRSWHAEASYSDHQSVIKSFKNTEMRTRRC